MNFNKNDIEFYLLTKEYDALTKEELLIVNEAVESKEEYQSLKQLLLVMEEAPVEVELVPAPEVKEKLVAAFEKARWGTEVNVSTEPKVVPIREDNNKKKGGFFWLSIAASLTLLIGLFFYRETLFMPKNNQLAMIEVEEGEQVEIEQPKNKIENLEKVVEELEVEIINETEDFSTNIENTKQETLNSKMLNVTSENEAKRIVQKNSETFKWTNEVEEELSENLSYDEVTTGLANSMDKEIDNISKVSESSAESSFFIADDEDIAFSDSNLSSNTAKDVSLVSESVSLKDDKDLIGLLYTAL